MHLTYLAEWEPGQVSALQFLQQIAAYHRTRGYVGCWLVASTGSLASVLRQAPTAVVGHLLPNGLAWQQAIYEGLLASQELAGEFQPPALPPDQELLSVRDITRDLAGWCPPRTSAGRLDY